MKYLLTAFFNFALISLLIINESIFFNYLQILISLPDWHSGKLGHTSVLFYFSSVSTTCRVIISFYTSYKVLTRWHQSVTEQ